MSGNVGAERYATVSSVMRMYEDLMAKYEDLMAVMDIRMGEERRVVGEMTQELRVELAGKIYNQEGQYQNFRDMIMQLQFQLHDVRDRVTKLERAQPAAAAALAAAPAPAPVARQMRRARDDAEPYGALMPKRRRDD